MILLTSTSDLIQVITASAGTVTVHSSFVDNASGTFTPGRTNVSIATAATTTAVSSPGASVQRNVRTMVAANTSTTISNLVEIRHTDGATVSKLWNGTLLPGESVSLTQEGRFVAYTSGGIQKITEASNPVDIQIFTSTGTWTKPTSFTPRVVNIEMYGAGGGGGAGASLATAVVAKGGGGGGGGS